MLSDFFRINMPYGIARNKENKWMAFNREYMPLGYNNMDFKGLPGSSYLDLPIYTEYKNIKENQLLELADDDTSVHRDENGIIEKIFLYDDGTNPVNQSKDKNDLWEKYFNKLKTLSKLRTS